jgi:signal transduction histidine kinase
MPFRNKLPVLTRALLGSSRPWVVATAYLLVFLLLDWVSFVRPLEGLNITPWNPQPALAVALLLASRQLWWVVLAALIAAEVLVRGVPGDLFVMTLAASALTCSYLAMAAAFERTLGERWRFSSGREMGWFLAIIAVGALFSSTVYVGAYAVGGFPPPGPLWMAMARYWLGDVVGMLVTLPILVAVMDAERRHRLSQTLRERQAWAIGTVIALLLWAVLAGGDGSFNFSYLLLLPVIWASMRFGVAGAVLASLLTQGGLIVATQLAPHADQFVFELQLLMATITITALLLGVVVDERERADADLRRTLRLAAAGQMSAALAHELSQPLNAVGLYAQALDTMASAGRSPGPAELDRLLDVARRMAGDARRAGDVVKRLRDFFRSGDTRLEPVSARAMIDDAVRAQAARLQGSRARITPIVPDALPSVWIDPVQLQVVLRNLLANGLDAALERGAAGEDQGDDAQAEVTVFASTDARELTITVADNGPGLGVAQARAIFEPAAAGQSHKVGGMGVGLSICRAIVEAHGGRLWAEPGPRGRLCFTLPLGDPVHDATPPAA